MNNTCEICGLVTPVSEGKYLYYRGRMVFACKACANQLLDEMKCALKICAAIDTKKGQAEEIINNRGSFDRFLKSIESTLKKIPDAGNLLSDIPLLVSLMKSYVEGTYTDIPYNKIVAVVATLLYVVSPIDIIPDIIPEVGFTDDAMAVDICKKTIQHDLDQFMACSGQHDNYIGDRN